jgi:Cys-tRNA(Pro)/Cys-tRNA(Cys) deacylase
LFNTNPSREIPLESRDVTGKGTPATALLARAKVTHRMHAYEHGSGAAYGPEAAETLGLDPAHVFKTLVAEVDGALTVGVVPVSAMLDLKALAAAVGGKRAKMADVAAAERATGYVAGGISPLGQRKRLPTVVDASAEDLETMFCSAGRRGLEVELAPADLARLTNATFAPIATS